MDQVKDLPESIQLRILSLLSTSFAQPVLPDRKNRPADPNCSDIPESKRCQGRKNVSGLFPEYRDLARMEAAVKQLQHNSFTILDGLLGDDIVRTAREEAEAYPSLRKGGMGGRECKWSNEIFRGDHISFLLPQKERSSGNVGISAALAALESLRPLLAAQGFPVDGRVTFQLACYPGNGESYVKHRDWSPSCRHRRITATYYLNPMWEKVTGGGVLRLFQSNCASSATLPASEVDATPLNAGMRGAGATTSTQPARESGGRDAAGNSEGANTNGCRVSKSFIALNSEESTREACVDVDPLGDRLVLFRSDTWHEVMPSFRPRFAISAWFSDSEPANLVTTAVPPAADRDPLELQLPAPKTLPPPSPLFLPSANSATSATSATSANSQIFVSIACFRDSECRWTVRDLFAKAAHPSHVRVGIVWQVDREEDEEMMDIWGWEAGRGDGCQRYEANVRQMVLDWREATGPCKARHLAQTLWKGEEYFFQIDAHMRFAPGWDIRLIHMLGEATRKTLSLKPVLSTYPPGYTGLGQDAKFSSEPQPVLLCASKFGQDKLLRIEGRRLRAEPRQAMRSRFWAAGYSFSRSELIREVPYDPNLPFLFFGEEVAMAVRMFTSGWDVFTPPETVVFHLWTRNHRPRTPTRRQGDVEKAKRRSEAWVRSLLCQRRSTQRLAKQSPEWSMCEMCGESGERDGGEGMKVEGKGEVRERGGVKREVEERREVGELVEEESKGLLGKGMGGRGVVGGRGERRLGNGLERSVREFVEFCGVDFCVQRISEEAKRGGVGPDALLDSLFDVLRTENP